MSAARTPAFDPAAFEKQLRDFSDRLLRGTPSALRESVQYSLLSAGKRIRPRLLALSAAALGVDSERVRGSAAAIEMVHCYTLIHDDLPCMDDDDVRRGMPTNHRKFGEATALLAGDALQALALEAMLEDTSFGPLALLEAQRVLLHAMGARGVIAGQAREAELVSAHAHFGTSSIDPLIAVFAQKTGELFAAALEIPAALAERPPAERRALREIGLDLGVAFQIADDLEDVLPSSSTGAPLAPATHVLHYGDREHWRKKAMDLFTALRGRAPFLSAVLDDVGRKTTEAGRA